MAARRASGIERRAETLPRRLETGIAGLDHVLSGGLLVGGLYLLAGPPGSGKTVVSNQICFDLARRGQRSLYLTLLTESHGRMVENVSGFAFFDRRAVGRSVVYVSGYRELRDQGLDGLRGLIEHEVHRLRPALIVVDGVAALAEAAGSHADFRLFLNKIRVQLELHTATGLLCMPSPMHEHEATQTMADGVMVLVERPVMHRAVRELTVTKFRGSGHVGGRHVFEIDARGVTLYPRSEAVLGRTAADAREIGTRRSLGVVALDEMLGGGVPGASVTAAVGSPGSGKTTLGLHFLSAGAKRRESGLYFGFYEAPERLLVQAGAVGIPLRRLQQQGRVELCWTAPYEKHLDPLLLQILERVRQRNVRRVFIDGLDGLTQSSAFAERVPAAMSAFANELRARHVTTLVAIESPIIGDEPASLGSESAFVENLILLRYVVLRSQTKRLLSVVKVRGSGFDSSIREFAIGARGIEVERSSVSAEAILNDIGGPPASTGGRVHRRRSLRR